MDKYYPKFVEQYAEQEAIHSEQNSARAAAIEAASSRIGEETHRFREVLLRKYHQLTFIDDYETRETERFYEEIKRFVSKRLPDMPAEPTVDLVFNLVSQWAAEEEASRVALGGVRFDPSMSPVEYERFCALRFTEAGWTACSTKASGDQGADIICEANEKRLVVQCKLYSGSVGNESVQQVIAAREFEFADKAAVVSNAPFTRSARALAATAGVLLLHHDEIGKVTP
jgi:restriction system protein